MIKVSVISIALSPEEFEPLRQALAGQTFQDFEFVGQVGGAIPETWNRAIARAQGEILVFVEAGAVPVNERWLQELVEGVTDERTIVKGLEITNSPLDPSILAGHRQAFIDHPFDEDYPLQ